MGRISQIEQSLLRSRRALLVAIGLMLCVLVAVLGITTWQVRQRIRDQIAGRDGEVLYAMALMYYAEDVKAGLGGSITDPGNQLNIVLRSSELRGVMGVRLFDPQGRYVESFPIDVTEQSLSKADVTRLRELRPVTHFDPRVPLSRLFYPEQESLAADAAPVLEVNVPLHTPGGPLAGIAQYLLEGQSIAAEYARLDRHLAFQAGIAALAGSVILGAALGWAFRRLRRAHQLVAERTQNLLRANQELAFAAKTSALGAVTAHLIHGLKNPLAGLQQYVASRNSAPGGAAEADWRQAVATTRRMQETINQVVGVLREEQTGAAYEITVAELEQAVLSRVGPLAREKGVKLETVVQADTSLPNRAANLVILILVNLVQNAVQETPSGRKVILTFRRHATNLRFEVSDEGPGFPADVPLFQPCISRKDGGTGIGLALCKQLANHLGAELVLARNGPEGCLFTLMLPVRLEQPEKPSARLVKLLIPILLSACLPARAVDFPLRWRWSNPEPHGGLVVDMAYSPALGLGVQVAGFGQIYTSSDLDLWLPRDCPTSYALRGVAFFGSRILIVGEDRTVLYADDVNDFRSGTLAGGPATNYWLEAVAASPQLAVAAGDGGHVLTSNNGINWVHQDSGTRFFLRGAACGNNVFVVVGKSGTILTSPNGTNWSPRNSLTTYDLNRVNFANNRFTAVGANGVTRSSTDNGSTWFAEYPGATSTLQYAATGGTDRLLDGIHEVRLTEDNLGWSNEIAKTNGPPDWSYYSAIGRPGYFLIAGQTGLQSEGYQLTNSPYAWLMPHDSVRNWLWEVMRLPSFYVTVGDFGTVMTSGNGVDWILELVPPQVTNTTFLGIGGTTNLLLAVGDTGTMIYSPNIVTNIVITNATGVVTQTLSSLGVLWYNVPNSPTTNDLQGIAVLSNSLYVVTGSKGVVFTSPNGTNGWGQPVSNTTNLLSSVTAWPGGLITVGKNGTLLRSPDATQWTPVNLGINAWLYRVRWLNQQLVVVGQGGVILTSPDGVTWSIRASGTSSSLYDATFIQDTWFAIGLGGTVLTSTNLVNWTSRGTLTTKALYGAATDSQQLILVGLEGVILRSQVVPDLTPVNFLNYACLYTNTPPTAYNLYLFGGKPDQRFTLDRRTNVAGTNWTTGPRLEIFDGSGTLYYLETLTGTNIPPAEYYRSKLEL